MESKTNAKFRALLSGAPLPVQIRAKAAYTLWSENPEHPSLRFKKVHASLPIYSVRINLNWRAVGTVQGNTMIWLWIGSHHDYEKLLSTM